MDCVEETEENNCGDDQSDIEEHTETIGTSKTTEQFPTTSQEQSSSKSSKPLSTEKILKCIKMRRDLLRHLEELEQREVSFEDEQKELFYLRHEQKIKKSILGIEKILYENGVLEELDEDLRAFHSNTPQAQLIVVDTGSKLLNEKLTEFVTKNSPMSITPSFEELVNIMHEVRKQEGSSSTIPDPEHDGGAFLERLEKVAFMVTRNHQKLISEQFLDHLDLYVPKTEREQCSTLPEISSDLKDLLTADSVIPIPDEIFQMEMRTAGRLEQQNSNAVYAGEEIDITNERVSDVDDDEDESDENEEIEATSTEIVTFVPGRGSENVVKKEAAVDLLLDNHCETTDVDSISKFEAPVEQGVMNPTSACARDMELADNAEIEYKEVTDTCLRSQPFSQGRYLEDRKPAKRANKSKIIDVICIDD